MLVPINHSLKHFHIVHCQHIESAKTITAQIHRAGVCGGVLLLNIATNEYSIKGSNYKTWMSTTAAM